MNRRLTKGNNRTGAAMVEFAICAPLLFLLFFASMEFCRVAMIRHTADNAVYEGCRVGIIPGATNAEVVAEAQLILNSLALTNVGVNVTPAVIDKDTDEVTVRVTVPLDDNAWVPNQFVAGRTIDRQLTLRREGIR